MTIIAAADGSALGNPGPAGWAWYVDDDHWASGGWPHGTNNMGELTAVLDLLRQTAPLDDDLLVYCDSTYVINTITKWMAGWKRRGWKKGDGKPVMNLEIVQALDQEMTGRRVRFEWVKGHAGHELNEAADRLANAAATAFRDRRHPDAGPGFDGGTGGGPSGVQDVQPDLLSLVEPPAAAPASDEDRVIALERSLLTDEVRSDPAAVAALLHRDWQEFGTSGRHWDRPGVLAEIGPVGAVEADVIDVRRLGPDAILLLWRASSASGERWRSSVWVREGGDWMQLFGQGTPIS